MESSVRSQNITHPEFLSGSGEMGSLIRSFNWSKTSLGPVEKWPQSLRSALSICLNSNFPIAIYWGEDLTLLYNDAWSPIPGNKHPWALGRAAKQVWPEIWNDIEPQFRKAFAGQPGGSKDALLPMQRHGYTEECYFDFTFTPVYGEGGKVEGVFNAVIETTRSILNERQLQTLRDLSNLDTISKHVNDVLIAAATSLEKNNKDFPFAVIYKIDEEGKKAKPVAYAGIKAHQKVFPSSIDLTNPAEGSFYFCKAFSTSQIVVSENNGRRKNLPTGGWDREATHFIHVPIIGQGRKHPFAILSAALNPYRKLDESYRQFIELISDQVSTELNNVLAIEEERKRAEALAEIDKAKTTFFSNISHEFRTPLTLMLGSLEELLKRGSEVPANTAALEITHRNAIRLLRLVNNLLDFSRIEAGKAKAKYQLTDISKYTVDLASNFRSLLQAAGLSFYINTDAVIPPVYLDREMWEKIVLNLLSNAFKYTLKGSITVSLTSGFHLPGNEGGDAVVLKVKDTGVGIPEAELPKMFQRFHRVQNSTGRTFEGSGIGLSLVSELVKLHGGEIYVSSKEGEGTEFTVAIPVGKNHLPTEQIVEKESGFGTSLSDAFIEEASTLIEGPVPENEGGSLENKNGVATVLVVDDNADMRAYIKSLLQKQYQVVTATNGMDALQKIKSGKPQLVLSDIMMPVMDGIQLVKAVKEDPQTSSVPVILLSARAGEEEKLEGFGTGADDYLVKPFSAKELVARVHSQISLAQKRREVETQLNSIFKQAPAAIALVEVPGQKFIMANAVYQRLFDRTEEQLIGKTIREVFPEVEGQGIYELFENVFQTGEPFTANEFPALFDRYNNGERHLGYYNFVAQPIKNTEGAVTSILIHAFEVTEQIEARKKIEESEEQLRIAIEGGELGTYDFYPQTGMLIWSPRTKELFGLPPNAEVNYATYLQGLHPDDRERSDAAIQKVLDPQTGRLYENEYRTIGITDGKLRWVRSKGKVIFDDKGRPVRFTGVTQDITKQKEILASLQLQSLVLDRMDEGVSVSDENGYILLTNPAENEMFGYGAGELIGKHVTVQNAYQPQENERRVNDVIAELKKKGFWSGEWRNRKKDGTVFYTFSFITSLVVDGNTLLVCVQRDISEEKAASEKLAYRTALLEAQNEAIPDAILIVDAKGKILSFNQHFVEIWKIPQPIIDRRDDIAALEYAMTQLADPQAFIERVNYCYNHPEEKAHEEVLFKDGRIIERYGNAVLSEEGTSYGWAWYFRDITERKKIESVIKESEEKFRTLSEQLDLKVKERTRELAALNEALLIQNETFKQAEESSRQGSYSFNLTTGLLTYSDNLYKLLGYSPHDFRPSLEEFNKHVHPDDREYVSKAAEKVLQTAAADDWKYRMIKKNGQIIHIKGTGRIISSNNENLLVGTLQDITDDVALKQILQSKNLELERSNEDLQQFAHVASHDLKEPVRKIRTFGSRLEEEFGGQLPEKARLYLDKMQSAADRMFGLINGVLNYSTINSLESSLETVNLNEVIQNIEADLEVVVQQTGAQISSEDLPVVKGSSVLLNQLFYNLLSNSLKFSKAGVPPHISIRAKKVRGGEIKQIEIPDAQKEFVQVRICDNGIGFSQEYAEKIFKTFTRLHSRDQYEGTGLGLALCKKIVERHKGYTYATAKEGEGACFYVVLPV